MVGKIDRSEPLKISVRAQLQKEQAEPGEEEPERSPSGGQGKGQAGLLLLPATPSPGLAARPRVDVLEHFAFTCHAPAPRVLGMLVLGISRAGAGSS